MMIWLGFDRAWVALIMCFISTISYSVNVNGMNGPFSNRRGVYDRVILLTHSFFLFVVKDFRLYYG